MTSTVKQFVGRLPGLRALRDAWWRLDYRSRLIPNGIVNRKALALRGMLRPMITIPCTAKHESGARFCLGSDFVDDAILHDLYGCFHDLFFPIAPELFPENGLILDVGGHHGVYACAAAFRYPSATFISIEPDPDSVRYLRRNITKNGLQNRVEIIEAAIADSTGRQSLLRSDAGSWGNRLVTSPAELGAIQVPSLRLETILRGRRPFIVKCNCEGGEFSLIPQLFHLGLTPPHITLMTHPDEGDEAELVRLIKNNGYEVVPTMTSQSHPRYVCQHHSWQSRNSRAQSGVSVGT